MTLPSSTGIFLHPQNCTLREDNKFVPQPLMTPPDVQRSVLLSFTLKYTLCNFVVNVNLYSVSLDKYINY
jgi:hypothetical protein